MTLGKFIIPLSFSISGFGDGSICSTRSFLRISRIIFAKLLALPSRQLKSGGHCVIRIAVAPDISFPLTVTSVGTI